MVMTCRSKAERMAGRVGKTAQAIRTELAAWVRHRIAVRKRRLEHEREFYRKFNAYCREHNLCPLSEDDWKSYSYYDCDRKP